VNELVKQTAHRMLGYWIRLCDQDMSDGGLRPCL
jgi:hypothetical protein